MSAPVRARTLYVSDLDGTLLGPGAVLSDRTRRGVNALVRDGWLFTYATARSWVSASRVVAGLDLRLPVAVSGGAFLVEPASGRVLAGHYLPPGDIDVVLDVCRAHHLPPVVYTGVPTAERAAWVLGQESPGLERYLADRPGDPRFHPVATWSELPRDEAFYATVIGDGDAVDDLVTALATATEGRLTLIPQVDAHHPEDTYLELSASGADKAGAVARLRELVQVDRVVAFGDNLNDLPMFAAADEAYAVANAAAALRAVSTGVIDSNTDDGVARWLASRAEFGLPDPTPLDPTPPGPV